MANSQYDNNSKLAFSFPEETDSPWQLRPKMFAYFFVQISLLLRQRIYTANTLCGLAVCTRNSLAFTYTVYLRKFLINKAFPMHRHEIRPCLPCTNAPFCTSFFFCPFNFVLQMSSEVRPSSRAAGVADVFNGTWFVSWW